MYGSEEARKAARLSKMFAKLIPYDLMLVHVLDDLVSYEEAPDTPIYQERLGLNFYRIRHSGENRNP